jgi:hypothetical protein
LVRWIGKSRRICRQKQNCEDMNNFVHRGSLTFNRIFGKGRRDVEFPQNFLVEQLAKPQGQLFATF